MTFWLRFAAVLGAVLASACDDQRIARTAQFHPAGQTALTATTVDPADLRRLGFSMAKARTIVGAAREIVDGDLDLPGLEGAEDAEVLERLTGLHGVGRWTAQYVMLRGLGRLEIFPGDDVGARNKLKSFLGLDGEFDYERVESVVSRWAPYAGLVYFHLLLDSLSRADLIA